MHESIWRLFFRENVTKIPENASLQWDPHSNVTSPGGEHGGNEKNLARFFFSNMKQKLENLTYHLYIYRANNNKNPPLRIFLEAQNLNFSRVFIIPNFSQQKISEFLLFFKIAPNLGSPEAVFWTTFPFPL